MQTFQLTDKCGARSVSPQLILHSEIINISNLSKGNNECCCITNFTHFLKREMNDCVVMVAGTD